jgi:two-component system, NtrC family, sensor histidine kinase AtoS
MRKHVLLWVCLMLFCFITGGFYIVSSIRKVTDKLESATSLQHVEYLRLELEHYIENVQTNLLLQGSPHSLDAESEISLVEKLGPAAKICLSCHHTAKTYLKLDALGNKVDQYMALLSRTLTLQASDARLDKSRTEAFSLGASLLQDVKSLSFASADKIAIRIAKIHEDIDATNRFLIACLVLGPIAIIIITIIFLKRFTGSIKSLVAAAHALEGGNLDYRINQPLKDEFRTLADSFNGMVDSLQSEQQKVQSISKLYKTLFEAAGDAIMITSIEDDSAGRIISANSAASELYGYSLQELHEMELVDLIPKNKEEQFKKHLKNIINDGWSHTRAKRRKKDGNLIPVDLSIGPIEMDERKYLLSICTNISERLRAEEELQRANQMALVGQMSAGLAHEIKNPLAGIKVSLDVLADELELKPEDQELFSRIINEINRMEKLLKSLLNYARPPQPQFDLSDVNLLLSRSLENIKISTGRNPDLSVCFEQNLAPGLPEIEADSAQLQQVFLNILLNAIDAMETDGKIAIITRMEGDKNICIEMTDTGKGIPEETLQKIFSPFFTTKKKGTGLGLAICKRLIEQHGGTILARSQVGSGTSFVMTLPLIQEIEGMSI